jgi:hypothetical protein
MQFGAPHHLHDLGVPRIDGSPRRADRQGRLAIQGPGDYLGAGRLGHVVGFAGQERFVHRTVPRNHEAIHGTDLVRKDDQ